MGEELHSVRAVHRKNSPHMAVSSWVKTRNLKILKIRSSIYVLLFNQNTGNHKKTLHSGLASSTFTDKWENG